MTTAAELATVAATAVLGAGGTALLPAVVRGLPGLANDVGSTAVERILSARTRGAAAVAGTLGGAALAVALGPSPQLVVWVYVSVAGMLLAVIDWRTHRLPTAVLHPSYAVVAALPTPSWRPGSSPRPLPRDSGRPRSASVRGCSPPAGSSRLHGSPTPPASASATSASPACSEWH